ncbi:MAG TPA: glyoxylate/hydroxypyruvate reductase A [Alcaligenes sp.]|nr:glyoxylate/hydroxypyruvate reductase A [Alcaligenes sp.]HRL28107.1 glyoxylate/hydroxypyruvate reductase A [Alcaligenes sp.]
MLNGQPHLIVATPRESETQRWAQHFRDAYPDWRVDLFQPGQAATGAQYAVVWQPDPLLFSQEPSVRAVFNLGAGVDAMAASILSDMPLYRLEDAGMAEQMAEYALYGVLQATGRFRPYEEQAREGRWKAHRPVDRKQWPVAVLGLGVIGRKVADVIASLGYPVHGWSRTLHQADFPTYAGQAGLHDCLAASRILVNALPLTAQTRGLINEDTLSRLQPGAYLINLARGAHIVDQDVLDALDSGQLSGALLDVFTQEPLPADHPYWGHPGVMVTPHISGITLREQALEQIGSRIALLHQGQPVEGRVDVRLGY